jgi:GNAT superfamily N-acetyltransferase
MKIIEYNDVDPIQAMYVPQLALGFPHTPEKVARLRATDPRPFPCLAIYAVEDDAVMGQVGIFRLPMISAEGREDVGGIWAVSTHPQYTGGGVASALLEEAHARMRAAGLRFSTLGTDRYRQAHRLYRRHGYQETDVWATALAPWETAHQPTRLHAAPPGPGGFALVEQVYLQVARDYLGFSWRHIPFAPLRRVSLADLWILQENNRPLGYAIARADETLLSISNLTLQHGVDAAEAVAALAAELKSEFIQVVISRPVEMAGLRQAGFHVAHPTYSSFMVKPLVPDVTFADARRLFGIGSDRFLISWLDVT